MDWKTAAAKCCNQRHRSDLLAKMQAKYDETLAASISERLAYFYHEANFVKVDAMWDKSGGITRRFFVLSDGRMGMGPLMIKETDIIVILPGGRVPYALRPSQGCFMFLGECYLCGLMYGNLDIDRQEKTFRLL
jgi:hypothetical protein